ncbi:hypothetical protein CKO25_02695 [Thiocapsa imhoffii]|uniref:NADAR domain-containing protein n=1 Tax=Thiocapsa imhoffii TaxID=382777 RepID=A0A9X0WFE9_9GAMM|nr:NADAR family protein [Thiocapsa imhoffii]MBK1643583.1 hypothetical protein [Thiocapsa imhoffii]
MRDDTRLYISMSDAANPLSSVISQPFRLDEFDWPTAEHYMLAMLFEDPEPREAIRTAADPAEAHKQFKRHKRKRRPDWEAVRRLYMTRAIYTRCQTHPEAASALLQTGDKQIIESSLYDYYWGCGRDGRGHNTYGEVLMDVRERLREEARTHA